MAKRVQVLSDEEAAFLEWVRSSSTVVLVCHVDRHRMPDITSAKTEVGLRKGRRGGFDIKAPCVREVEGAEGETCGTQMRKVLGSDGVLEWGTSWYEYDSRYQLPPGVTGSNWNLSKAQRGIIRKELMRRKNEREVKAKVRKLRQA